MGGTVQAHGICGCMSDLISLILAVSVLGFLSQFHLHCDPVHHFWTTTVSRTDRTFFTRDTIFVHFGGHFTNLRPWASTTTPAPKKFNISAPKCTHSDRTFRSLRLSCPQLGSDIRPKIAQTVRILMRHGGHFWAKSVRTRIGHIRAYAVGLFIFA